MKIFGLVSITVLFLILGTVAPAYSQEDKEQHDQQQDKHVQPEEKKAEPEKSAKPEAKQAQEEKQGQEEKHAQPEKQVQHEEQHEQPVRANANQHRRIPDDRFRANFGREHVFVINRPVIVEGAPRFQYGGYWFGFGQPWPAGWAYTDNVYVDFVDGGYYLYNPVHPGIRIVINVI